MHQRCLIPFYFNPALANNGIFVMLRP